MPIKKIIKLKFKVSNVSEKPADWSVDASEKYLQKVRYNPLEELWVKIAKAK